MTLVPGRGPRFLQNSFWNDWFPSHLAVGCVLCARTTFQNWPEFPPHSPDSEAKNVRAAAPKTKSSDKLGIRGTQKKRKDFVSVLSAFCADNQVVIVWFWARHPLRRWKHEKSAFVSRRQTKRKFNRNCGYFYFVLLPLECRDWLHPSFALSYSSNPLAPHQPQGSLCCEHIHFAFTFLHGFSLNFSTSRSGFIFIGFSSRLRLLLLLLLLPPTPLSSFAIILCAHLTKRVCNLKWKRTRERERTKRNERTNTSFGVGKHFFALHLRFISPAHTLISQSKW